MRNALRLLRRWWLLYALGRTPCPWCAVTAPGFPCGGCDGDGVVPRTVRPPPHPEATSDAQRAGNALDDERWALDKLQRIMDRLREEIGQDGAYDGFVGCSVPELTRELIAIIARDDDGNGDNDRAVMERIRTDATVH